MDIDFLAYLRGIFTPEQTIMVGITGRAGAGKTTLASRLVQESNSLGFSAHELSLDWFFKLSSSERKAWLIEGKTIGEREYENRTDQLSWWDYEKLLGAVSCLLSDKPLELKGVYNRQDKGELTRDVFIPQNSSGRIIVLEGVGIAHLDRVFNGDLIYVHADSSVRMTRLLQRDADRRKGLEAAERFRLTEAFELGYFHRERRKATRFVDNSGVCPKWVEVSDLTD